MKVKDEMTDKEVMGHLCRFVYMDTVAPSVHTGIMRDCLRIEALARKLITWEQYEGMSK